jgi:hypothetical protein
MKFGDYDIKDGKFVTRPYTSTKEERQEFEDLMKSIPVISPETDDTWSSISEEVPQKNRCVWILKVLRKCFCCK